MLLNKVEGQRKQATREIEKESVTSFLTKITRNMKVEYAF